LLAYFLVQPTKFVLPQSKFLPNQNHRKLFENEKKFTIEIITEKRLLLCCS
jgi:hypothetical protein